MEIIEQSWIWFEIVLVISSLGIGLLIKLKPLEVIFKSKPLCSILCILSLLWWICTIILGIQFFTNFT